MALSQLARYDGPERFDVLPLLVATDGAIAAFGRDDTLAVDRDVLRDIMRRFDRKLALNASVLRPGAIRGGDRARLVGPGRPGERERARPKRTSSGPFER